MNLTGQEIRQKSPKRVVDPAYLGRVAQMPCAINFHHGTPCSGPIQVHHVCHDRFSGIRAGDDMTIPLCLNHHLGADGIHTNKRQWRKKYGADYDYIPWVKDWLGV